MPLYSQRVWISNRNQMLIEIAKKREECTNTCVVVVGK